MKHKRFPMTSDQPAQIDCRKQDCIFNTGGGNCTNISPAITLNETSKSNCWSYEERKSVYIVFTKENILVGCFDTEEKANKYINNSPNNCAVKTTVY